MKKYFILFKGLLLLSSFFCAALYANENRAYNGSKRIEVYSISQNFWDVKPGETLGEIVIKLLPHNPAKRESLALKILSLNPDAFSGGNPDKLRANIRLWLPNSTLGSTLGIEHKTRNGLYEVKSFSWGQVYRTKR